MSAPAAAKGTLYLVPTPLDHGCDTQSPLEDVLPLGTIKAAAALTHWLSENAKSTRAFLKRVDALVPLAQPIQAQQITELPREVHKKGDHGGAARFDARPLLAPALQGQDVGLISEAGMPAVADPGSSVVRAAHGLGITVVPLVGPVSILLARLPAAGRRRANAARARAGSPGPQDRPDAAVHRDALPQPGGLAGTAAGAQARHAAGGGTGPDADRWPCAGTCCQRLAAGPH